MKQIQLWFEICFEKSRKLGKGKHADYQHFLLFPLSFQEAQSRLFSED